MELTERFKMHYLDQDTFMAVLQDVWKRHAPQSGMSLDQPRESLLHRKAQCSVNVTTMDRPASIRFLETNPKHFLGQNFPSKRKLGEFSLRGELFPLRDNFPLKIAFPFP